MIKKKNHELSVCIAFPFCLSCFIYTSQKHCSTNWILLFYVYFKRKLSYWLENLFYGLFRWSEYEMSRNEKRNSPKKIKKETEHKLNMKERMEWIFFFWEGNNKICIAQKTWLKTKETNVANKHIIAKYLSKYGSSYIKLANIELVRFLQWFNEFVLC